MPGLPREHKRFTPLGALSEKALSVCLSESLSHLKM